MSHTQWGETSIESEIQALQALGIPANRAHLMLKRAQALGIRVLELRTSNPEKFCKMSSACGACPSREGCAADLLYHASGSENLPDSYCPNRAEFRNRIAKFA